MKRASNWLALGVGLVLLVTVVQVMRRPKPSVDKVVVGSRDEVYFSHPVTRDDASKLGHALQATGFFRDLGATVRLAREHGIPVVSFVLDQGAWERADAAATFEEIGRRVAPAAGGFPIEIQLVDTGWTVHKSLAAGKAMIGAKDAIYYLGAATDGEAKALGQALRDVGYLQDLGVTVAVWKDAGTALGFVVNDGVWERPEAVAGFENLARRVAPSVGGLPVQLRLLNSQMETEKEMVVR